jgi:hypothetical protein
MKRDGIAPQPKAEIPIPKAGGTRPINPWKTSSFPLPQSLTSFRRWGASGPNRNDSQKQAGARSLRHPRSGKDHCRRLMHLWYLQHRPALVCDNAIEPFNL